MANRVFSYIRIANQWTKDSERTTQRAAINAIASLQGLKVESGNEINEVGPAHDQNLKMLIARLSFGDVLIVASPSVLSDRPLRILELASQLMGAGIRLLVASLPNGNLDLAVFRGLITPMQNLEDENAALKAQLVEQEKEHAVEFETYAREYEQQVMKSLNRRGISLGSLLRPEGATDIPATVDRPSEGRQLKQMRERLGLNQTQAGALAELDGPSVSRIEAQGSGHIHYAAYSVALSTEGALQADAERKRLKAIQDAPTRASEAVKTLTAAKAKQIAEANIAS